LPGEDGFEWGGAYGSSRMGGSDHPTNNQLTKETTKTTRETTLLSESSCLRGGPFCSKPRPSPP
jgi:hypothetical protein